MRKVEICPSILAANYSVLDKEIKLVESLGVNYLHIDVMDGKFVSKTSFSLSTIKHITKIHNLINDVHIMIENPKEEAAKYLQAGADILTFHLEATSSSEEVFEIIDIIHSYNKKAGISIKPMTKVESLIPFIDNLDLILIMSVEPGLGGQEFMMSSLDKISFLRKIIDERNLKTLIEVDGGINEISAKHCKDAGADILVSGSFLFGHTDIKERLEKIK